MVKSLHVKIIILFFTITSLFAQYPERPLTFIVGFGKGGSTDRMLRTMEPFLSEALKYPIVIDNKAGMGSQIGAEYFLQRPQDGYTLFASTFSPYIPNHIIIGGVTYKIEDFELLNLQWFDYDLIAVHQEHSIGTLLELLEAIKKAKQPLKAAVMYRSSGHMNLNLLLESFDIPQRKLEYHFFEGGQKAREALVKKNVDFIVIAAQGSETVREHINPLALFSDKRAATWDAPTISEAIKSTGKNIESIRGSMRGIAVSKEFKREYPQRYDYLIQMYRRLLAQKKVQYALQQNNIGFLWIGPKKSNAYLEEAFKKFLQYDYLLDTEK